MIDEKFILRSSLPPFLGDFNSLLRTALMNKGTVFDFIDGLKEGKTIGLQEGTEATIKNMISSGNHKIMVTNEGKIIPFSNTLGELMEDENVKNNIKQ